MKPIDRTFKVGDKVMVRNDIQHIRNMLTSFMFQQAGRTAIVTYVSENNGKYELNDMSGNYLGSNWRNIDLVPVDNDDV